MHIKERVLKYTEDLPYFNRDTRELHHLKPRVLHLKLLTAHKMNTYGEKHLYIEFHE